ncbi:restriction endonuclease subunit S [Vibrio sp. 1S139]|uniref:restriction endonuclease subunit S n=1 Tax=Vibrio sp. 1S139 TaxID=3230006 RepID=UPI00352FCB9C
MSFELHVPEGWYQVKLSDLGEVNRGRSRHRPRDAAHLYGGPYPFVQTGDVKASKGRITQHSQTYSEEGLAQSRLWPKGTMCITIAANIAETGILTYPACFPDSVIGFIADESKCNVYFIEYVFRLLRKRIQAQATGSVQDNINLQTLERLLFPIPALEEQNRIAAVLGELDDKIHLNYEINQTLEEMAQAIFKSWFVDFDPVKAKMNGEQPEGMDTATASLFPEKLVESELGFIPEGWEVDSLSSVVDVIMGQSPKGTTYNDQNVGTPLVNGPVEFGVYHPVAQKWTTAPTKLSKDKDLIVCVRGSTTGRYVVSDGEYCLGRGVCSVRSDDYPAFANYLFKSQLNNLLILTTGSTFPSWSGPTLKHFKVVVPPKSIIEKYEAIVGNLCSMMAQNTGENESLASLRDTLLPKLLSGEIDLENVQVEQAKALAE